MPLIPQQDIVRVRGLSKDLGELLTKALENYPEVRIVSVSHTEHGDFGSLLAVVETI